MARVTPNADDARQDGSHCGHHGRIPSSPIVVRIPTAVLRPLPDWRSRIGPPKLLALQFIACEGAKALSFGLLHGRPPSPVKALRNCTAAIAVRTTTGQDEHGFVGG